MSKVVLTLDRAFKVRCYGVDKFAGQILAAVRAATDSEV
jgi:hypothetical protein